MRPCSVEAQCGYPGGVWGLARAGYISEIACGPQDAGDQTRDGNNFCTISPSQLLNSLIWDIGWFAKKGPGMARWYSICLAGTRQ